jgi:hypothetical protein
LVIFAFHYHYHLIYLILFALSFSFLSESILHHHTTVTEAYAQPYVETVKYRNLTIDHGNGLKTNAQLTIPAVGDGPFPGVINFPGSGAGSVLTPYYGKSFYALDSVIGMIGNVTSNTCILILIGENDSQTPLGPGLLLQ